ncbi:MAG: oxygenase MpaB family protein [Anaerolineales bacterium]
MTDQRPGQLLRRIWSNPNCVLLVFAGSSAEFAINPAAEWLFYTGKLPADPIGRFVSTLQYVRRLMFAPSEAAYAHVAREIRALHTGLEKRRGQAIPAVAYRDVLFMNLEYSIRSFPFVFGRDLTRNEKDGIVADFADIGELMSVEAMPADFEQYQAIRRERFQAFRYSQWTTKLLEAYRRAIGNFRFRFLLWPVYGGLTAREIRTTLGVQPQLNTWFFRWLSYPVCRTGLSGLLYRIFLPPSLYKAFRGWSGPAAAGL